MTTTLPQLSIIVPVLNDATQLRGLLDCLAEQEGIRFEVILCDGGSTDETQNLLAEGLTAGRFTLRAIKTARGRGVQMNAGADVAIGNLLLFLHADSRFTRNDALLVGIRAFEEQLRDSSPLCAARFRLRFRRTAPQPSLAYYYHEAKARLNRCSCIRGDQGYLIERSTFEKLGRFDCSLPFLEDVRLAARLAATGEWLLLPVEISTSARRFEREGFYERQVANVIIVNALETGWDELLSALPGLYCCNSSSGRLLLLPLVEGVHSLIKHHDRTWRQTFWRATGAHVAANAWQLFFWLDVRAAFRAGQDPGKVVPAWLKRYERRLKPLFESRLAACLAEALTRIWLWWLLTTTRDAPSGLTETSRTDGRSAP